ncbi:hypothetical protein IU433_25400 [Nocardia puris]|uniref:hypothetical protein n=1 Tax=Nocardia puris TaxID=208602 RepID=UPI001894993C|nr:hypothetical protein [Nocardia puris]MBF6214756.1 hypothetical protein [Nocardia puris]MBF6368770.1 hypothetical protein [Nocardia puris]MBF6462350.1 hypothetical protein [Nocardia puris]
MVVRHKKAEQARVSEELTKLGRQGVDGIPKPIRGRGDQRGEAEYAADRGEFTTIGRHRLGPIIRPSVRQPITE